MNKIPIILGPTATGKTDLALKIAKKLNGELVACDSRQVYQGLDMGTGKLPTSKVEIKKSKGFWQMDGVKVWMYDIADPSRNYTVFDYVKEANQAVEEIVKVGKLPIVVGGTGLYLKALLEGLSNFSTPTDLNLRKELANLSVGELQQKLSTLSPSKYSSLTLSDQKNKRRLIRQIELIYMNPYTSKAKQFSGLSKQYKILKIGLTAPRAFLNQKIDSRVLDRFQQGLIHEVESLLKRGVSEKRFKELGLEYSLLASYLKGELKDIQSEQNLIQLLQSKNRQYAKRQMTWYKKEQGVYWFDISQKDYLKRVEKLTLAWYNMADEERNNT